jgi:calcineurin-like phosphoesterase family protein
MLLIVVFMATLVILAGGWSLIANGAGGPSRATHRPTAAAAGGSPGGTDSSTPIATLGGVSAGPTQLVPSFSPGPSGEPATVVLTGAGDIAKCGVDGDVQTSDLLATQDGWFFTLGDDAYENGSAKNFADCYAPTWGRFRDRTILPVVGNHEWLTPGAAGYRDYFGLQAEPNGRTWYSMDLGAWHVIVLDSDCSKVGGCNADSEQGKWLANDLAQSSAQCTLALWHHPRFSSGEHCDNVGTAPFWQMLYQAGAELVLNGHDHDYERFSPMDPSGNVVRPGGIREIVVGTGGGGTRPFSKTVPNSEFRLAGTYGVLRLTLHPASYDWEFLPTSGSVSDSGSAPCH